MFLVVNSKGNYWDGFGWNQQGKVVCSPIRATRSLHENGEDLDKVLVLPVELFEKVV